ncbi:hypothetical protein DFR52_10282 [Hoeflea marina]|uniref:Uncharacterized protein n=1 Tax=Hoeflea marina TaxID=274592 RepID=A0A317PMA3_9HYPH|nr:hypothetical protein DFR52_10282 [Hoeflea marina]
MFGQTIGFAVESKTENENRNHFNIARATRRDRRPRAQAGTTLPLRLRDLTRIRPMMPILRKFQAMPLMKAAW